MAALAAFKDRCGFLKGGQVRTWPPSTPPRPCYDDTTQPEGLSDPSPGVDSSSTVRVTIVNSITTVTNTLALLVLLASLLAIPAPAPNVEEGQPILLGLLALPSAILLYLLAAFPPLARGCHLAPAQHQRQNCPSQEKCHRCHCRIGSLVSLVSLQAGTGLTRTRAVGSLVSLPEPGSLPLRPSCSRSQYPRQVRQMANGIGSHGALAFWRLQAGTGQTHDHLVRRRVHRDHLARI